MAHPLLKTLYSVLLVLQKENLNPPIQNKNSYKEVFSSTDF